MALQKRQIEHIKIWQASGLTQAVYCQQQGLNAKTFSRWFKTYQLSNQPTKPLLIPVEIKPAADTLPATEPIWLRLHVRLIRAGSTVLWMGRLQSQDRN